MEMGSRREKVVTTLLHDGEYEELREAAYVSRKSVSGFLRDVALAAARHQQQQREEAAA